MGARHLAQLIAAGLDPRTKPQPTGEESDGAHFTLGLCRQKMIQESLSPTKRVARPTIALHVRDARVCVHFDVTRERFGNCASTTDSKESNRRGRCAADGYSVLQVDAHANVPGGQRADFRRLTRLPL